MAANNNPSVISANFSELAARDNIDVVRGQLLPQVSVIGDLNSRRGRVLGMESKGSGQAIKALVPMSESTGQLVTVAAREALAKM